MKSLAKSLRRLSLTMSLVMAATAAHAEQSLTLTLDQAVDLAARNSLGLQAARLDTQIEALSLQAAWARFGRNLTSGASYQSDRSPSTSKLEAVDVATSNRQGLSLGMTQALLAGGQVGAQFSTSRYSNNAAYFSVNPVYNSGLELSLSQPLWRGRGRINRVSIELAQNGVEGTRLALRGKLRTLRASVGRAYWDQYSARAGLDVSRQLAAGARRVLDLARAQADMGTGTRNAALQAEVAVARRDEEVVVAEGSLMAAQDQLKTRCGLDQAADAGSLVVVVSDSPAVLPFDATVEAGIERALAGSTDYQQALLGARRLDLQLALAHDQTRPKVDLNATVGITGVGGNAGDNLQELGQADSRSWRGGLSLSMPLGDDPSQAALAQRQLEKQRSAIQLDELRLQLSQQVRDQHRQIGIAARRIEVAQAAVGLAERSVDDQEARLALGLATVKEVLDAQDDLASARVSLLRAMVDHRQALLQWEQLTGP